MRLNKYISSYSPHSRREADKLIEERKVKINGEIAELGQRVQNGDRVELKGKIISRDKEYIYIMLNKPIGITSTTERHIEGNIVDFVGHNERIFPIGRLDKNSEGLIILTNDGDIVNKILREEYNNKKEYIVGVNKNIDDEFIKKMESGVIIFNPVQKKNVMTKKCEVTKMGKKVFKIVLSQGLNRQIRRMCESLGCEVLSLKRIKVKNIELGKLQVGKWRYLNDTEMKGFKKDTKNN